MAKPRKVIRTKNLYKKNVLPPKAVGAILFFLLMLFIIIVGFVLMHEMTIRFGEDGITTQDSVVAEESPLQEEEPPVVEEEIIIEEILPDRDDISRVALINSNTIGMGEDAIKSSLEQLALDEFTTIAFELKPISGMLVYDTSVELAYEFGAIESDNGFLSLEEIIAITKEYDFVPVAYLSTLQDTTAHVRYENSYAYSTYSDTNWLDNSVSLGGKSWLNPYMEATQEYISELASEMYDAGFGTIFLDNVIFPTQNTSMMNTIKTSPSKEQMLTDFVEIVANAVPKATIYRVEDLTFTAMIDDYTGDAVSIVNYNTVLSRCESENIAVFMSLDNIANRKEQIILREDLSLDNTADSIDIFKELLEKTVTVLGSAITVVVTEKDLEQVEPVLDEFDIVSFIVIAG